MGFLDRVNPEVVDDAFKKPHEPDTTQRLLEEGVYIASLADVSVSQNRMLRLRFEIEPEDEEEGVVSVYHTITIRRQDGSINIVALNTLARMLAALTGIQDKEQLLAEFDAETVPGLAENIRQLLNTSCRVVIYNREYISEDGSTRRVNDIRTFRVLRED